MSLSNPTVSVIIPVYNTEDYLPECIDSVLCQTLGDIEVICIDDLSPDRCGAILDEYALEDPRVKVIHLDTNQGQGYGRNRCIEHAKGKYLYFLDSDDTIASETLKELSELADKDALDAIFFDMSIKYENEELRKVHVPPFLMRQGEYRDDVVSGIELMNDFFRQNEWTCFPQRSFWRRDLIQRHEIRYLQGCIQEDEFFVFAGILVAKRVRYVRKPYFTLRIRPNSVMSSPKSPKNLHGYLMNLYYMNEFIAKHRLYGCNAEINVTNMYHCAISLYEMMKDGYDLDGIFVKEPDQTIYRYFMTYIRLEYGENGLYSVNPETLKEIQKYRSAYIYGTGPLGRMTCKTLKRHNVLVEGFLTDEPENSPSVLMGRSVWGINQKDIPDSAIVVVAANPIVWDEIHALLENRKIHCVSHRKLSAVFPPWAS